MKQKPRRGSAGLALGATGLFGVLAHLFGDGGNVTASDAHYLAMIGSLILGLAPYLIEKIVDVLNARTGGNFSDTGDAILAAIGDGRITRDEIKQVLDAGVDDIGDLFSDSDTIPQPEEEGGTS